MFKGAWYLIVGGMMLAAAVVVGLSVGFIDIPADKMAQACEIGAGVGLVAGLVTLAVVNRNGNG